MQIQQNSPTPFTRNLGRNRAILIMIGNMIGVGIFIYPSLIASSLTHPIWFLTVWILGGFIAITGALSSAELAVLFPEVGGDYVFLKNAYGQRWSFLFGFLTQFITFPSSIAIGLSLTVYYQGLTIFGDWVRNTAFTIPGVQFNISYFQLIALGILIVLTYLNQFGLSVSIFLQKVTTLTPLFTLIAISSFILFLIFKALTVGSSNVSMLQKNLNAPLRTPDILKLGSALVPVYWTFTGWNSPLTLGSEIRDPEKVIPKIMISGVFIVTIIYLLFAFVFISVLPFSTIQDGNNDPYFLIGKYFLSLVTDISHSLEIIPEILSIIILLLVIGNVNSSMITGTRIAVAMSRDGLFWEKIGIIHPKRNTPVYSFILQSFFASIMILFIPKDSDLLNFSFLSITFLSVLTVLSIFIFRLKGKEKQSLYKAFGYPITPIVYAFFSLGIIALVVIQYIHQSNYSVIFGSIICTFIGIIVFDIWKKFKKMNL
ncbi:MAG: amino acid permease [Leptospiraceae bacterium]|nr:amino acid permease [Leptospiraceae bacterium]MCK6380796.1 amino acid permease [Leptospiraceae bacterium]NUM40487.1 amino acid permease [Leptospiraceae bacterium]